MNIKKINLTFILCLFFQIILYANSLHLNSTINSIQINGELEKDIVAELSQLSLTAKKGHLLTENEINKDINILMTTGYFKKVNAYSKKNTNSIDLIYDCIPNPKIKKININGNSIFSNQKILKFFTQKKDQILNYQKIEQDKTNIIETYKKLGYSFIKIDQISFDKTTGVLNYYIDEGTIAKISFSGTSTLKQSILFRELKSKKGRIFNANTVRDDRKKLLALGYFTSISPPRLKINSQSKIEILFNIIEKKVNRIDFGLEHENNNEDNLIISGFVNYIKNHTLIHSDVLSLKTQIKFDNNSFTFNNYQLTYKQPWTFNTSKLSNSLTVYNNEQIDNIDNTEYKSNRSGGLLNLSYPISNTFKTSVILKKETVSASENSTFFNTYHLNSLSLKLNYSNVKNRMNPQKGRYFVIEYEKGNDLGFTQLGGLSFSKSIFNIANFLSFKKTILATRFQAGLFETQQNTILEIENFTLGGHSSLRGHNESSLIGEKKVLANFEYRYNLSKLLQAVLFYDIGHAFTNDFKDITLKKGYGIGLRIITAVAPIRFDYAINAENNQVIIHFGLGQLF